jgi:hypothetical protein
MHFPFPLPHELSCQDLATRVWHVSTFYKVLTTSGNRKAHNYL